MRIDGKVNVMIALALTVLWLAGRDADPAAAHLLLLGALILVAASLLPDKLIPLLPTLFGVLALVSVHALIADGSPAKELSVLVWFTLAGLLSSKQGGVPFSVLATTSLGYVAVRYAQGYAAGAPLDAAPGFVILAGLLTGGVLSGWGRGEPVGQLEGENIVLRKDRCGPYLAHGDEVYRLGDRAPESVSPAMARQIIVGGRRREREQDDFLSDIGEELRRSGRSARPLTLVLILPKFGDCVWTSKKHGPERVRERIRAYDRFHPYLHGHALLLPDTDEVEGRRVIERLMREAPPQHQVDVVVDKACPHDDPALFLARSKKKLEACQVDSRRMLWEACQEADWSGDWQPQKLTR